jgi:hypothetical protein
MRPGQEAGGEAAYLVRPGANNPCSLLREASEQGSGLVAGRRAAFVFYGPASCFLVYTFIVPPMQCHPPIDADIDCEREKSYGDIFER